MEGSPGVEKVHHHLGKTFAPYNIGKNDCFTFHHVSLIDGPMSKSLRIYYLFTLKPPSAGDAESPRYGWC